ncbi:MAG: superfamily II DNA or RNA helicase [Planctomycetota bacterium]
MSTATFTSEIERSFDEFLRERGRALASKASLKRLIETEVGFVGQLKGPDGSYSVEVAIEGPDSPGCCSCPDFEDDGVCPHIWAAAILLNERKSVLEVPARRSIEKRSLKRLQALRGRVQRKAMTAWDLAETDSSQLVFVLDLEKSGDLSHVRLFVERKTVKVDGTWSAGKPVDLSYFDFEELQSGTDRRLLGLLGYGPNRFGSAARDWQLDREEHRLSAIQAGELLPLIAREGRLELRGKRGRPTGSAAGSAAGSSLSYDEGEPFFIHLLGELSDPEALPLLFVNGSIARGEEEHSHREIQTVLPGNLAVACNRLMRTTPETASPMLADLVEEGTIAIGEAALDDFRKLMGALPAGVWRPAGQDVIDAEALPSGDEDQPAFGDEPIGGPTAELSVQVKNPKGSTGGRLECDISFEYGPGMRVSPDSRAITMKCGETGQMVPRELEAEAARLAEYLEVGGRRNRTHRELGQDGSIAATQFPTVIRDLLERGWRVKADQKLIRSAGEFSISVTSGIDWFDVKGGVQFDGEEASFPELLTAAKSGKRTIELSDGSTGMIPEKWLESWGLLGMGEPDGDTLRFKRNQGWLLDAMLAERASAEMDADFDLYRKKLAKFKKLKALKEPAGFQGELRPYQRDALGWFRFLSEMGLGGCLADDMGLGKTVQVLALLESRRARRIPKGEERRPSIVVAPRSLVFNWIKEASRFAPKLKVIDYTGSGRQDRLAAAKGVDLLVTTYGSLRRDAPDLAERTFDHVILDEATAIKNASSQSAKAARLLQADHRLALTGTPVENNLHELWSLFEFLNPGMMGRSTAFRDFADRGEEDNDVAEIGEAIRPFFLRRTKDEVLTELPAKSEQVLTIELSAKDRKRYDDLKEHFRKELLGTADGEASEGPHEGGPGERGPDGKGPDGKDPEEIDKMHVLTALLRLRQAACHPGLIDESLAGEDSAKIEMLIPRLQELATEGHKVLVFSQFTSLLAIVKKRLRDLRLPFEYLDGKTQKRQEKVERFQADPNIPIFLISLKAGGHGLNLTASDHVFILDPWWNPAVEAQAIDRAHRMGQTRSVFAFRLISKDTVEERVMELQAKKRDLADQLFKGRKGVLKDLTRADLDALLS